MKLLMTTDTVGGVFVYATQLAKALQQFGVQVILATQGKRLEEDQRRVLMGLENVTLYESEYRLEWMHDPWDDVDAAGRWLQSIAKREQPDLLHLNDYSHAALEWQIPVLMVAHSCVHSWFHAVRKRPPDEDWHHYRRRVSQGLQGADMLVAPTRAMLRAIAAHYAPSTSDPRVGALGDEASYRHGRVIANGIAPLAPGNRGHQKQPLVLSAGRIWDEAKNIGLLADAAAFLRWPVHVAGECRHPDGGHRHFDGVEFLGRLSSEQLAEWYERAAIYALPARYEPFGLTPLEAAAAGCALVLGDIPSLREVWGNAAVFVDPEDAAGLAEAINRLSADTTLRTELVTRSRSRAGQLTADRMARGYWDLYQQLLRGSEREYIAPPLPASIVLEKT